MQQPEGLSTRLRGNLIPARCIKTFPAPVGWPCVACQPSPAPFASLLSLFLALLLQHTSTNPLAVRLSLGFGLAGSRHDSYDMKFLSGMLAGASECLSRSLSSCADSWDERPRPRGRFSFKSLIPPPTSLGRDTAGRTLTVLAGSEKTFVVLKEPSFVPPPAYEAVRPGQAPSASRELAPKKWYGSGRKGSLSVRRRLLPRPSTSSSSRRPHISAPSDFRHVGSGAIQFTEYEQSPPPPPVPRLPPPAPSHSPPAELQVRQRRPRSFRPLELSIYLPHNRLSSLLPHFEYATPPVTPPNRLLSYDNHSDGNQCMTHSRSVSSLSFHIPRKPCNTGSVFDSPGSDVITRPSLARVRAGPAPLDEAPAMDLIERVATAMLERDELQGRIEDAIERQSVYFDSRPSSAAGRRPSPTRSVRSHNTASKMEPMPEIPALPPNAPSFSQRLSSDRPPATRPNPLAQNPYRPTQSDTSPASDSDVSCPESRALGLALPPPLPLKLRPPLRKKKSFSRVSSWLGLPAEQLRYSRMKSLERVTNRPMPTHIKDGFYEVAENARLRPSHDSDDSVSEWSEEDIEKQTLPTSCSPSNSISAKAISPPPLIFGSGPYRASVVGVAF